MPTPTLFPNTRITIEKPLPTAASGGLVNGKLHLEFDVDIAQLIGACTLSGDYSGFASAVGGAIGQAGSKLLVTMVMSAQLTPKGSA